jgi:hypothetical protein
MKTNKEKTKAHTNGHGQGDVVDPLAIVEQRELLARKCVIVEFDLVHHSSQRIFGVAEIDPTRHRRDLLPVRCVTKK